MPARTARAMRRFELDPATVKVDWALDGPVPWASPPAHAPGTVHVADSVAQMSEAFSQIAAGSVPGRPVHADGADDDGGPDPVTAGDRVALGLHPRAAAGAPRRGRIAGTTPGGAVRGVWDADDTERFADRMQARVEALAPGFGSRVRARRVLGPRELEARNANLVGGAVGAGTSQLHQMLVFRPVPGLGRAETPIRGLYLASASAHPGGGVSGAPGHNAARAALAHARLGRLLPASGVRPRVRRGAPGAGGPS